MGLKVVKGFNHDFQPDKWYDTQGPSCHLNHFRIFDDGELVLEADDPVSTRRKNRIVSAGTRGVFQQSAG